MRGATWSALDKIMISPLVSKVKRSRRLAVSTLTAVNGDHNHRDCWRTRGHQTLRANRGFFILCVHALQIRLFKPRFHFPCVLSVIVHCFTGVILGHRCCLLGTIDKSKAERLALSNSLGLQPYVRPRNSLTKIKSVIDVL